MEKMRSETFKDRFGENTAIAALAVIVEDEEKDRKRLIHEVRVNHRIKCRDKLRARGLREDATAFGGYGEEGKTLLDSGRHQEGPPPLQAPC